MWSSFLIFDILICVWGYLIVVLNCISLDTNDVERLCLFAYENAYVECFW
jgi:hypothetical protein